MSLTIYVVRHGRAEEMSPAVPDEERRLTQAGRSILLRAAVGLRRLDVFPHVALSSPLVRALETSAILMKVLAPDVRVVPCSWLAPGTSLATVLAGLNEHGRSEAILVVGHEPMMGELASCLLTGSAGVVSLPFKPGAVAAFDSPSLGARATLRWFLRAEHLAEIGVVETDSRH